MKFEGEKKIQDNIFWSSEMRARGNFAKMVEISINLKNCVVYLEFQCPKCSQIILKFINLALPIVEFFKFRLKLLVSIFFPDCYPYSTM